jgi:hypothetical protein
LNTVKHRIISGNARPILEDYIQKQEELGLRHIKEVENLYVNQERERKELDQEMRLEVCKRLVRFTNKD